MCFKTIEVFFPSFIFLDCYTNSATAGCLGWIVVVVFIFLRKFYDGLQQQFLYTTSARLQKPSF